MIFLFRLFEKSVVLLATIWEEEFSSSFSPMHSEGTLVPKPCSWRWPPGTTFRVSEVPLYESSGHEVQLWQISHPPSPPSPPPSHSHPGAAHWPGSLTNLLYSSINNQRKGILERPELTVLKAPCDTFSWLRPANFIWLPQFTGIKLSFTLLSCPLARFPCFLSKLQLSEHLGMNCFAAMYLLL